MSVAVKFGLLLLYSYHIVSSSARNEVIMHKDRPYDLINISIPRSIWNQALKPTPILRSPVTIVVPVHVNDEDNDVDDEYIDSEVQDEVVDENVAPPTTVVNDVAVQQVVSSTPAAAPITNATQILEDPTPPPPVTGQVVRFPCSCPNGQCGCCTGTFMERFRMKACGNISFIPEDFVFDVRLTVNNQTVVRQRVSASDPPPICFNPRRAPFVRVCAEISNIRIRDRNAFACLDINADIGDFPIYSASFRCFGLGTKGVQTGLKPKPVSSGPKPVSLFGSGGESEDDGGGILGNVAGGILGGADESGILSGFVGGGDNDDDDDGPFDGIGEVVGDFFGERRI